LRLCNERSTISLHSASVGPSIFTSLAKHQTRVKTQDTVVEIIHATSRRVRMAVHIASQMVVSHDLLYK